MLNNFEASLKQTLAFEDGYANNPADPGGATNKGVTQRTYDAFRKRKELAVRPVKEIGDHEVSDIYRKSYWVKARCNDLPAGVDFATFDGGVSSGVSRGVKWLQGAVGSAADAICGRKTIAAAKAKIATKTVKAMCAARLSFLQRLKIWKTFGGGWGKRVSKVEAVGVSMALAASGMPTPPVASELRSQAAKASGASKAQTTTAATATAEVGAGATQVDWSHLGTIDFTNHATWAAGAVGVGAVAAAAAVGWLAHKSSFNKSRAAAYSETAAEVVQGGQNA